MRPEVWNVDGSACVCVSALELEREQMTHLGVRVIELHHVSKGGGLCDLRHHDTGSVKTEDLILADGRVGHITGGHFQQPPTVPVTSG